MYVPCSPKIRPKDLEALGSPRRPANSLLTASNLRRGRRRVDQPVNQAHVKHDPTVAIKPAPDHLTALFLRHRANVVRLPKPNGLRALRRDIVHLMNGSRKLGEGRCFSLASRRNVTERLS
jgi:hypothetical protein